MIYKAPWYCFKNELWMLHGAPFGADAPLQSVAFVIVSRIVTPPPPIR